MLDYIRLVCDGDLSVLVASGTPLEKDKEAAKMDVLSEFAELSGNESTSAAMSLMAKIYELRAQRLSYIAAMYALDGEFDGAREFFRLRGFDVSGWTQENPRKALKRINAEIKGIDLRLSLKIKEYNALVATKDGKAPTERDIRVEMAVLSQHQNHAITNDCDLATYAGYKHTYGIHVKSLEDAKHRVNTR